MTRIARVFKGGLIAAALACSCQVWAGTPPGGWVSRTSPTTQDLRGIVFGNGTFVAVGNSGTVLTSPDGINWMQRASGTSRNLAAVAFGASSLNFTAVGDYGTIIFSDDKGGSWGANNVDPSYNLLSVASKVGVGERWVVVGNPNKLLTTTHPAVPWSQSSWPSGSSPNALAIAGQNASGTSRFVVTGRAGQVATSTDGNTWQLLSCGFSDAISPVSVAADLGNIFLAAGFDSRNYFLNLISITDTSCSTKATTTRDPLNGMAYGKGYVVGVINKRIGYYDTAGPSGNWTAVNTPNNASLNAVAYGNGTFVAVGTGGAIVQSSSASQSNYVGCFKDDEARALPVQLMSQSATVASCVAAAKAAGYAYVGLQYGGSCFAGNTPGYQQVDVLNEKQFCNMPCTAASSETCGGSWYNSIHKTGVSAPAVPEPKYEGCYSDAANRALPVVLSQSGATRKSCVAAARARGLLYAGLQYGGQCFAGNTLGYQKAKPADEGTACRMKCSADSSQDCGGIWFNTVYSTGLALTSQPPASAYQGCFEDRENRALPVVLMPSGATAASCYNAAKNAGYLYAGLQWNGQCYAGNTLGYAKVPQQDEHKPGKCDTRCTANQGDWCGGGWHNSVYKTR